jgi:serine/threonine-protein kinase CLA4
VVAPLEDFIDDHTDPRDHYIDLHEVAEGESGSVYAARVVNADKLNLPTITPPYRTGDGSGDTFVAIKNVPILPSGSPKLDDLHRELTLMKGVRHEYVLGMDALYVDLVEDSLWIRMELMERSLADVVGLVEDGLMVQERMIARFASDVSLLFFPRWHVRPLRLCNHRFFWPWSIFKVKVLHTGTCVQIICSSIPWGC